MLSLEQSLRKSFKNKIIYCFTSIPWTGWYDGSIYKWLRHRGLAVNAPDWGLAHRFLVGTAVQGNEIFQVQFDVASSTATCYYGLWLSLVLTGNPYLRSAIGEGLSLPKLRAAWSGIGGCYRKASSQSPPSRTPKCVTVNGVGCVMWGTCTTSTEDLT